jgi:phenylpropionate dioxygenase-like ring-hydroxylating dioxygenase large terminal subunit
MFLRNCWYAAGCSRGLATGRLTSVTMLNEPLVISVAIDEVRAATDAAITVASDIREMDLGG